MSEEVSNIERKIQELKRELSKEEDKLVAYENSKRADQRVIQQPESSGS